MAPIDANLNSRAAHMVPQPVDPISIVDRHPDPHNSTVLYRIHLSINNQKNPRVLSVPTPPQAKRIHPASGAEAPDDFAAWGRNHLVGSGEADSLREPYQST